MAKKKKSKKSGVNSKKNNARTKKKVVTKNFVEAENLAEKAEAVSNEVEVNETPKREV